MSGNRGQSKYSIQIEVICLNFLILTTTLMTKSLLNLSILMNLYTVNTNCKVNYTHFQSHSPVALSSLSRIYVDAVINHMASPLSGIGTAGSHYDGVQLSYPGVPYNISDFKGKGNGSDQCATKDGKIHNYNDPNEVRNCRLVGFPDLAQNKEHVRSKIAEYMNRLIDIGVAGFRVDGSKFMWPRDLSNIFARLTNLNSTIFGSNKKPFIYQEIYDMGDGPIRMSQYYGTGRVTNFDYGKRLSDIFLFATIKQSG